MGNGTSDVVEPRERRDEYGLPKSILTGGYISDTLPCTFPAYHHEWKGMFGVCVCVCVPLRVYVCVCVYKMRSKRIHRYVHILSLQSEAELTSGACCDTAGGAAAIPTQRRNIRAAGEPELKSALIFCPRLGGPMRGRQSILPRGPHLPPASNITTDAPWRGREAPLFLGDPQ